MISSPGRDGHAPLVAAGPVDVRGVRVVVLGGGRRAHRIVPGLVEAGAAVRLVAGEVRATLENLPGDLDVLGGAWSDAALDGAGLLVVTGDDPGVRGAEGSAFPDAVARAARERGLAVVRGDRHDAPEATRSAGEDLGGTVALVGGGPGDDGLLTLRGRELLLRADVVVADRLAPQGILAELGDVVEIIDAAKIPYGRQMAQEAINAALIEHATAGRFVVRLKGGDNFLFGRGYEEALALAEHGIRCLVVPGVTSAFSAPALGGVTVTHRGVNHDVTVISGHVPPGHPTSLVHWPAVAAMRGTVVLLMAVKNGPAIADALVEGGRAPGTPVAIIESASLSAERRVDATLGTLRDVMAANEVRPPAIIVVGEVAGLPRALLDGLSGRH